MLSYITGVSQSINVTRSEVQWVRITLGDSAAANDSISPYTIPYANVDAQNPCRKAGGLIWDLRSQIEYYKTHAEVYGNFYELIENRYVKTKLPPPTDYGIRTGTNWITTNLVSKMSWFRMSGWVSAIVHTNNSIMLLIDTWDAVKKRKVKSYCLYHPKSSQFTYKDYVDCMVYNNAETFSHNNTDYDIVQYGIPDYNSENFLPPRTNSEAKLKVTSVEVGMSVEESVEVGMSVEDSTTIPTPSAPQPLSSKVIAFESSRLMSDFSISLWCRVNDYNNAWPFLIQAENSSGGIGIGIIGKTSGSSRVGTLYFVSETGIPRGEGNWAIMTPTVIPLGVLCHVVVVKQGNAVFFYLNGKLIGQSKVKHTTFPPSRTLRLGHGRDGDNDWRNNSELHGTVTNVRIYNRALSASEVAYYPRLKKGI